MPESDRIALSVVGASCGNVHSVQRTCITILANGGWNVMPEEKDLPSAYYRALEAGMGVVIPVRDHNGRLVISHGPATDNSESFEDFLAERSVWPGQTPAVAIRVCSDGLSRLLHRALTKTDGIIPYLFGMSVTDMTEYLDGQIPIFVRQSEHEPQPPYYEFAEGVWLDSFERDWFDERLILNHLRAGKLVSVVSPEIHDRSTDEMWSMLKKLQGSLGELASSLQLCTDRPQSARDFFSA